MKGVFSISTTWKILSVTTESGYVERADWALSHAGLSGLHFKGGGQKVGVVDTGCDAGHQDLSGKVEWADFVSEVNAAGPDLAGHGTFVTGEIIAKEDGLGVVGVAPEAKAFAARVLTGTGQDMYRRRVDEDLGNAIRACVDKGCRVINMSLGGPGGSQAMKSALDYAVSKGVIPVAAAGNERMDGAPARSYPAAYDNVISVAAANKKDMPYWFSTIGVAGSRTSQPEIAVASKEFYYGCLPRETDNSPSPYGVMIGTSMAAPVVAGALLLWAEAMEEAGMMPEGEEVLAAARRWLYRVAKDTNQNGWDPELGYGVLLLDENDFTV